jgi:PAS domain S-box-containing protein
MAPGRMALRGVDARRSRPKRGIVVQRLGYARCVTPPATPRAVPLLLAVVWLLLAGALGFAWSAAQSAARAADELQRTHQVTGALALLAGAVHEAESAPLADAPAEVLTRASAALQAQQSALRTLLAGNGERYNELVALGPLVTRRLEALAGALDTAPRPAGRQAAAPNAIDTRRLQERIRTGLAELQQGAAADVATAQQRHAAAATRAARAAVLPGAVALVLLAALAWRLLRTSAHVRHDRAQAAAAQAAQRLANDALQQLFAAVPDALLVLDSEARVQRANPGCLAVFGRAPHAIEGRLLAELVFDEDQRRSEQALRAAVARPGEVQTWHNRGVAVDGGSRRPLAWRGVWSAEQRVLVCVAQDRTELEAQRAAAAADRAALQAVQAELAQVQGRADAAGRLNSGFIQTLGERMRPGPLAIASMVDILLQGLGGPLTREQQRELASVREHARTLQGLVSAGLDIAALEAGQLPLKREAFDVWETVHEVADGARPALQDKGLTLEFALADHLGYARGDGARVAQVLRELLHNAARFTERGGVTVAADVPQPGRVRITVADTGIGIAPDDQAGLFEPFHRATDPLARPQAGSGLGLAVCRRLARLMGGDLTAESTPGQGSRFTFTLPADTLPVADSAARDEPARTAPSPTTTTAP